MKHTCAILSVGAALLGPLMFGLSLGFSGPAIDTMKNNILTTDGTHVQIGEDSDLWVFTTTEASLFGSLVTVGAMIGALGGGPITEKFGRKWTLFACSPLFVITWLWTALANSSWQLIAARVINGIAVGVCSFVAPTYIGEVSPTSLRGMLGAGNQLFITIGILLAYLLGLAFRTQAESTDPNANADSFCDWRMLCWLYLIPSVLLGVCVLFAPETPRWLADKNRGVEAKAVLLKLRGGDENDEEVKAELAALEAVANREKGTVQASVFQRLASCKMQLFIGIMLQVMQQFSGINAVIFYQTSIFQEAGLDDKDAMALSVMAVQVGVTVIACAIMDKAGRRVLLLAGAAGMCVSAISMGLFFYLKDNAGNDDIGWLAIVSAYAYISSFSIGVGAIPWLIMAEIFPDEVRGLAASIATTVNWLCGFFVTMFLEDFKQAVTFVGVFWIFAGVCAVMIVFVLIMVPETKGKSFEEIQDYFKLKYGGKQ